MRKIIAVFVVFILSACISVGPAEKQQTVEVDSPSTAMREVKATEPVGVLPDEYTRGIIGNRLLVEATKTEDGYLLPSQAINNSTVTKYDLSGKFLWKVIIPYDFDSFTLGNTILTNDGGFAFTVSPSAYQKKDGTWANGNPTVFKCDKNGKVIWSKVYKGFSDNALGNLFETKDGELITIGTDETVKTQGIYAPGDIYISKLSCDGKLLQEKRYGGSDYDSLDTAEYQKGVGLVAVINTQSKDGTFSAAKECYNVRILARFNDDLEFVWYKIQDTSDYIFDSFCIFGGDVYASSSEKVAPESSFASPYITTDIKLEKISLDGTIEWGKKLHGNTVYNYLGSTEHFIELSCGGELLFLNSDGQIQKKMSFDNGRIEKVIEHDDYYLIISENETGILDTPPMLNCQWFTSELVYSGYDDNGKLLWRDSFDNTWEQFRKHKYVTGSKVGVDDFIKKYKEQIGTEPIYGYKITPVTCYNVTPKAVIDKAKFRIFKFSDSCASFLLYEGKIYASGESFGGYGVVDVVVCDLNKDGVNELLYTYSWGSGLHRSQVGYFDLKTKNFTTLNYTHLNGDMMLVRNWDYSYSLYEATIKPDNVFPISYNLDAGKHLADIVYENNEIKVVKN